MRLGGGDYDGPPTPSSSRKALEFPWKSSGSAGCVMRCQRSAVDQVTGTLRKRSVTGEGGSG